MKIFFIRALIIEIIFLFSCISVKANTIITAPIDSRPISTNYLGNLSALAGDTFISVDKSNLDYFSAIDANNHFAESKKVRQELEQIINLNNTEDTTVIINTSSYITNGLVGSRCGINYKDFKASLNDLYNVITNYPNPKYYINLSMPRTLPETRFNKIWREDIDEPLIGLGYYYLKYNEESPLKDYISKKLSVVSPSQFLLEWSYIKNKKFELGEENLTPWEIDFLKAFKIKYENYFPYKTYIYEYELPYHSVAEIFRSLLKWHEQGLIEEIIISNDDFQLPDSISYIYNNTNDNWITLENSTPIKYSFARTYMTTGPSSIYKQLLNAYGDDETYFALKGMGKSINFIFGTDEVPQLIYARDLSKRKDLTTNIKTILSNNNNVVEKFDVIGVKELLRNDINFVTASKAKTDKQFDLFVFDYIDSLNSTVKNTATEMTNSLKKENNVGLIEIFRSQTLNTGENKLFKLLLDNAENSDSPLLSITDLSCYSAWNTNANAIGLGIAHAQVFGITEQTAENNASLVQSQLKMLGQHVIEDGIFTIQCKRILSNERFIPSKQDTLKSDKLYNVLASDKVINAFKNNTYKIKDTTYKIDSYELSEYNFPWGRTFECFLDFKIKSSKIEEE